MSSLRRFVYSACFAFDQSSRGVYQSFAEKGPVFFNFPNSDRILPDVNLPRPSLASMVRDVAVAAPLVVSMSFRDPCRRIFSAPFGSQLQVDGRQLVCRTGRANGEGCHQAGLGNSSETAVYEIGNGTGQLLS